MTNIVKKQKDRWILWSIEDIKTIRDAIDQLMINQHIPFEQVEWDYETSQDLGILLQFNRHLTEIIEENIVHPENQFEGLFIVKEDDNITLAEEVKAQKPG